MVKIVVTYFIKSLMNIQSLKIDLLPNVRSKHWVEYDLILLIA